MANHAAYSARTRPIFGDVFLPNNVRLIYASDTHDSFVNRLLIDCDREASRILRELLDTGRANVGGETMSLEQIPNHANL